MDYEPHALLEEPLEIHVRPTRLHESLRMYLGYLVLGLICLSVTLLAFPMRALLPRALSKRLGRRLVTHTTRGYLHFLTRMGACRFDLSALDALRDGPAMVIAPNHPCLLDAVMILSRLPDAACIMK